MHKYFSADWIFPVSSKPIKKGVVITTTDGEIIEVLTPEKAEQVSQENIVSYKGALVPGFINTHCHLELSHMKGRIPERTGLFQFVQGVLQHRDSSAAEIEQAMELADKAMFDQGIVAVGDISNKIDSKRVKQNSKLYYHTFVEALGFNPERAAEAMHLSNSIKEEFAPLHASVVPHAPYSVSEKLFELIHTEAVKDGSFISVHNQETQAENEFFEQKTGDFLKLYGFLGLDLSFFTATGKSSLQSWLPFVHGVKTLLVHNTVSKEKDVDVAVRLNSRLYWCLCPQANLYIENDLPDAELLLNKKVKVTLGTDSLASNHQLNILTEMLTLQEKKGIGFESLLKWATLNGAEFLEQDHWAGSLDPGKRPGLNLIELTDEFLLVNDRVKKII